MLDISFLNKGNYIVEVNDGEKKAVKKLKSPLDNLDIKEYLPYEMIFCFNE